jgi:hypothetical protein
MYDSGDNHPIAMQCIGCNSIGQLTTGLFSESIYTFYQPSLVRSLFSKSISFFKSLNQEGKAGVLDFGSSIIDTIGIFSIDIPMRTCLYGIGQYVEYGLPSLLLV